MRINTNMAALNAWRNMTTNEGNVQKSLEKLSSGFRINRAADDAAGLAVSEKMRAQIRGTNMAVRNSQDGISLVQTAEGALTETHSILQRMRELAVQASTGTLNSDDSAQVSTEFTQLKAEVDRIATTTKFNTKNLLNGQSGVIATSDTSLVQVVGGTSNTKTGTLGLTAVTGAKGATNSIDLSTGMTTAGTLDTAMNVTLNGQTFSFNAGAQGSDIATALNAATGGTGVSAQFDSTANTINLTTTYAGSAAQLSVAATGGQASGVNAATGSTTAGTDATVTAAGATSYTKKGDTVTINGGNLDGLTVRVDSTAAAATANITVAKNNSLSIQVGAEANQTLGISINDMSTGGLGIATADVSNQTNASSAITKLDSAINLVSTQRASLGAVQNRLEHTVNSLQVTSENLSSAESRIRDVDMASEMANFTKNNILMQASQAMLAQANQSTQGILSLLR